MTPPHANRQNLDCDADGVVIRLPAPAAPAPHIALIGSFPPRRCGLATFTADTRDALVAARPEAKVDVFAMDDGGNPSAEWEKGVRRIAHDDALAYVLAADAINASGVTHVWLQHEFGIFGGADGQHVLPMVDRIHAPLTVTFHTILQNPSPNQRRIMEHLCQRAAHLVVMAQRGAELMVEIYGADPAKITLIPHGIPDRDYVEPDTAKAEFGFEGRSVILTFGLLSPDKGIDDMIEAMPAIVAACPNALYVVLGATHPHVVLHSGEELRRALERRAEALGMRDHVRFVDSYVDLEMLTRYLRAADVYATPYRNPDQITSGTLSYAVGLGKPVVSTPYVHAKELLGDGTGIVVPFRDSAAMAQAVAGLLADSAVRSDYAARAYAAGRPMVWSRYAETALRLVGAPAPLRSRRAAPAAIVPAALPGRIGHAALARMTDDTGMFQHGRFGVADRRHGYCVDDNCRALTLVSIAHDLPADIAARLGQTYAAFVQYSWNNDIGRFRNFMHFDRRWLEDAGSADSNGRTLHALALAATCNRDSLIREWAGELYRESAPRMEWLTSPRALAFATVAACEMERAGHGDEATAATIGRGARVLSDLLTHHARPGWTWFEPVLAYDNCRLAEAMIEAGLALGDTSLVERALAALRWIMQLQVLPGGVFRPVGSQSFGRPYAPPVPYDQQPIESAAAIEVCLTAVRADPTGPWRAAGEAAYAWFLGANDLGLPLADAATGDCRDGLTSTECNRNRGAESILAWQLAHRRMAQLRALTGGKDAKAAG